MCPSQFFTARHEVAVRQRESFCVSARGFVTKDCKRARGTRDAPWLAVADLAPRRRRFDTLEIQRPIARGGMGGVYLAEDAETGERVALKVLDAQLARSPDIVARLLAEHALASRAEHPGVLRIAAARATEDGVPYLVMEYLEGETLAQRADREVVPLPDLLAISAQIAAALAALHAAGVVHCDVKHDNVFITTDGRAKVIDFGVSVTTEQPASSAPTVAGTPWCMAPEQWAGAPVPASDVYALGCLLFELVTNTPPFEGSLPALMAAHLEQRPARPTWLAPCPPSLERLIMRALAKEPEARPTMHEMACTLADLADDHAREDARTEALEMLRIAG
jgi:eukaryotic-like serine/threonine-protein kinase